MIVHTGEIASGSAVSFPATQVRRRRRRGRRWREEADSRIGRNKVSRILAGECSVCGPADAGSGVHDVP